MCGGWCGGWYGGLRRGEGVLDSSSSVAFLLFRFCWI